MHKNLAAWVIGCFALIAAAQVGADWNDSYVDRAKVISAIPIYEIVEIYRPVERCYDERVVYGQRGYRSRTGTILGGIVGGVLGNQIGHGRGRTAATVAGTLLGASVGRDLSHRNGYRNGDRRYVTNERRCELVDQYDTEERLVGYRVKYRYKGRIFETRTSEHPGRRIPVRVDVDPLDVR